MQKLFAGETDWHTPWMGRVLPRVERLAAAHPDQTIFTRFIPARNARAAKGNWRGYYEKWEGMTLDRLPAGTVDLLPSLAALVPPADVFDKATYSPWTDGDLHVRLQDRGVDTILLTGGETDVCVLAAALGAVDLGYRTVLVTDALCSASDETHDDMLKLYRSRYGQQIETVDTETLLGVWK
ncbi:MAG: cysteine hydrolase [Parafilimonas terrae]|nr:cysteine hydrolase [Parafilimonas terrae]